MTLLAARSLSKHYGGRQLLDGVSFVIEERDRIGLIGRNGAGKSTLIRILTGREDPEDGTIERRRDLDIAWVSQMPELPGDLTVQEAVRTGLARHEAIERELLSIERRMAGSDPAQLAALIERQAALNAQLERIGFDVEHRVDAMIDRLKIPPKSRRLDTLSLGEQRRVALAAGLLRSADLLILDEPTNHLDTPTIEWLQGYLKDLDAGLLLVTHDRYFLDEVTTKIVEIDRGRLNRYAGNYTEYLVQKAERDALDRRTSARRARSIEAELGWVRMSAAARTSKQKARLKRFDELVANRPEAVAGEAVFQLPHPPRLGRSILTLEGVAKRFGDRVLIDGLDLELKRGDRIGIVGPNGAGKTTLVEMVLQKLPPDAGRITPGVNTTMIYADQARTDLDDDHLVIEEVAGKNDKVWVGERPIQVQTFLDGLLFDEGLQRTKVGALSGGERSRVSLAKSLREAGNLLILDEPTNDLDLATLRVLEEALIRYPGCALIVSHDRYFLDRVATQILAFEGGGRVTAYEGNYTHYLATRPEPRPEPAAPPSRLRSSAPAPKAPRTRRTYPEEQEFAACEARIEAAEARVSSLEAEVSDPETLRRLGPEVSGKLEALERARREVEARYARWEVLSELEPYGG